MKHQVRLLALALGLCLGFIKGGHVLAHNLDSYEFKLEIGHQDLSYLVNESGVKHYVSRFFDQSTKTIRLMKLAGVSLEVVRSVSLPRPFGYVSGQHSCEEDLLVNNIDVSTSAPEIIIIQSCSGTSQTQTVSDISIFDVNLTRLGYFANPTTRTGDIAYIHAVRKRLPAFWPLGAPASSTFFEIEELPLSPNGGASSRILEINLAQNRVSVLEGHISGHPTIADGALLGIDGEVAVLPSPPLTASNAMSGQARRFIGNNVHLILPDDNQYGVINEHLFSCSLNLSAKRINCAYTGQSSTLINEAGAPASTWAIAETDSPLHPVVINRAENFEYILSIWTPLAGTGTPYRKLESRLVSAGGSLTQVFQHDGNLAILTPASAFSSRYDRESNTTLLSFAGNTTVVPGTGGVNPQQPVAERFEKVMQIDQNGNQFVVTDTQESETNLPLHALASLRLSPDILVHMQFNQRALLFANKGQVIKFSHLLALDGASLPAGLPEINSTTTSSAYILSLSPGSGTHACQETDVFLTTVEVLAPNTGIYASMRLGLYPWSLRGVQTATMGNPFYELLAGGLNYLPNITPVFTRLPSKSVYQLGSIAAGASMTFPRIARSNRPNQTYILTFVCSATGEPLSKSLLL